MQREHGPAAQPALLPVGTVVGPWRVVDWAGCGVYGAVFRAVHIGEEQPHPVALKVALLPGDPRFPREVKLLARLDHPSVPHLLDHAPESWLFELQFSRSSTARYIAGPADDLYALGVTACRLVAGEYPELGEPMKDEHGIWHLEKVIPPVALLRSEHVEPQLRALLLRMLSVSPEERGSAAELAEALEQAAQSPVVGSVRTSAAEEEALGPPAIPHEEEAVVETDASRKEVAEDYAAKLREDCARAEVEVQVVESPAHAGGWAGALRLRGHVRLGRHGLMAAAAGLVLGAWVGWALPEASEEKPALARKEAAEAGKADTGPVGVGEVAASLLTVDSPQALAPEGLAEDTLPEPLPGQMRPNAKGRCPHKRQIALNGGCWVVEVEREKCEALSGRTFESTCYVPVIPPGHPPTSSPGSQP